MDRVKPQRHRRGEKNVCVEFNSFSKISKEQSAIVTELERPLLKSTKNIRSFILLDGDGGDSPVVEIDSDE